MKDFFNSPRTKKALKFWFWFLVWFLVWFWTVGFGFLLLVEYAKQTYSYDARGLFYIIVFFVMVVSVMILALFVKARTALILGATVGYYILFFGDFINIPFYYLNPAYYKYQSECKKLPKPVVYDKEIWEIRNDSEEYPPKRDEQGKEYRLTKSGKGVYRRVWRYKGSTETWWGTIDEKILLADLLHDQKLVVAKGLTYNYDGLVFRFGASGIRFMTEMKQCENY